MKTTVLALASLALASTALTVCARTPTPAAASDLVASSVAASSSTASTGAVAKAASPAPKLARVVVHKSPYCGCCGLWVEHMREAGFAVEVRNVDNLEPVKTRVGIPAGKGSCHTAEVDGYFIEGHVPADDVKRLLAERPDAKGLTVPGMPLGSPGMEVPDGRVQPYTVELVHADGSSSAFARHGR